MACFGGLAEEKVFFLKKKNMAAQLMFAKLHLNKQQDLWCNVLWTDQTMSRCFYMMPRAMFGENQS